MVSAFTLIAIIAIFSITSTIILTLIIRQRLIRLNRVETYITEHVSSLDSTRLQSHLQDIKVSVVAIDSEVTTLKESVAPTAKKHHLDVSPTDTQPDTKLRTVTGEHPTIRVLEKQMDKRSIRVS